ncbi:MAG TPA: hypothetical protein ENI33_03345, partial [Thermoplasmatales archaeon]|nr:hypothetical protein [Thermoplasmatales archaeon]
MDWLNEVKTMKMKKSIRKEIIFPLSLILLFSLAIPFTHAENGTPEMSILPEQQYVFVNETFTVDIVVNASEVYVAQCDISFNASLIEALSVENGDMFNNLSMSGTIDNNAGKITWIMGWAPPPGVPGGIFATITFKAKDKLGIANIDIAWESAAINDTYVPTHNATVEIRNYPVNLEISPSYALIGNWTKMLDVNVGPYGNEITVLNCNVTFNPTYFEVVGVTDGGLFPSFTYSVDNTTGNVFILANVYSPPGITTAGKLASIEFKPKQTGMSNINLTDIQVYGNGSYLYYTTQNATLVADLTPPTTDLILGEPNYNDYITSSTDIILNATDDLSGVNHTYYRIWWNGTWTSWMEYIQPFNLTEECTHYIEFYSVDKVNNVEEVHNVTLHVDNTPPSSTIEIGEPKYSSGGSTYINFTTPIYINATDEGLCKVEVYTIHWTIKNLTGGTIYGSGESNTNVTLYVSEECYHKVEYWVEDALGNKAPVFPQDPQYERVFYVDNSPPTTTLEIGEPYYNKGGEIYIKSSTPIYLNSTDEGLCKVGSYTIYYRILIWNDTLGDWETAVDWTYGNMNENLVIYISEECHHKIEYYGVDDLGNVEETHNTTVYVDNTPPTTTIEFGTPKYDGYITSATTITLNATDGGACISGINATYYRIWYNETWTSWMEYTEPFNLTEECTHVIEWYSV